ncbi:hypothetical protein MRX96_031678 [Rhipicephalus microplus]
MLSVRQNPLPNVLEATNVWEGFVQNPTLGRRAIMRGACRWERPAHPIREHFEPSSPLGALGATKSDRNRVPRKWMDLRPW